MVRLVLGSLRRSFLSRGDLLLENLALRQQLLVLKRRNKRPRLNGLDRLFWIVAKRLWSRWKDTLVVVTPETVVRWHHAGFRLYWWWCSHHRGTCGRKPLPKETRKLIFRMVAENPTWGAPRIHRELTKLGFDLSERTVSRWVRRAPGNPEPAQRWKTFLQNHREVIAAMDFFTVSTLWFGMLYCFFVIAHDRRRILYFNVPWASDPAEHISATNKAGNNIALVMKFLRSFVNDLSERQSVICVNRFLSERRVCSINSELSDKKRDDRIQL